MTTLSPLTLISRFRCLPRLVADALLLFAALVAALAAGAASAQEPGERAIYRESFDARPQGWSLDRGWTVDNGQLVGRDHRWARYDAVEWSCDRLAFRFALFSLKGTLHANVLVGDAGRYIVGFGSSGRILDRVYFKKQLGSGQMLDLGESGPFPVLVTPQNPLPVAITCDAGRIEVSLGGKSVLSDVDRRPLPAGRIAFETLDGSYAVIDDLAVTGFHPARLLTPDLRGLTVAAAERRHVRLKLDIVAVAQRPSEQPAGQIINQKPAPESPLPDDRRIEVWLSQGPELTPPLIGQNLATAQTQHPQLKIEPVGRKTSDRPAGEIIDQKPGSGRPLPEDRRIEVWLSQGPELTPQLIGQNLDAAQSQHPQLKIEPVGRKTSGRSAGEIIDQKPGAGRPLPDDRRIEVWLSLGSETTPQLVGQPLQAARTLHPALAIELVGRETNDRAAGEIVRQQPTAGLPLPVDRRIQVWLSLGPPRTPDLVGMTLPAARAQHAGLTIEPVGRETSERPAGEIVRQQPTAGHPLPNDSRIEVWLSMGPEQTPQLVGRTLETARSRHPALTVEPVDREASDRPVGEITRQQPEAGKPLPRERRILVWVSAGQAAVPVTPDLTGLSESEARQRHPEIDLHHVEGLDAASDVPDRRIVAQAPAPGSPLPADRVVRIGLSLGIQRSWTDSLPEIFIIAAIVGAIVLLRRLFRRRPPEEKPATAAQPLRVRPQLDPGRQDIAGEGGTLAMPALHLRCRADLGTQEIDYPRDRPEG